MKLKVKFLLEEANQVPFAGVGPVRTSGSLTLTWIVIGNFRTTAESTRIADETASKSIARTMLRETFMRKRFRPSYDYILTKYLKREPRVTCKTGEIEASWRIEDIRTAD